ATQIHRSGSKIQKDSVQERDECGTTGCRKASARGHWTDWRVSGMPEWSVTLNGDRGDLKALADLGVGVTEEGDAFVFRSPDMDGLTEPLSVHQHAVDQVAVF